MPIYEYRCDHCGNAFSSVQSFNDEWLTECPRCGKRPRRIMSAPAIVFKGSGWYKTDSRASSSSAEKNGAKSSEAKTETKSGEVKAETKSGETKAETKSPEGKSSETKPAA